MQLFNQSMLPYYLKAVDLLIRKSNKPNYTLASNHEYYLTTLSLVKSDTSKLELSFNHESYSTYVTVYSYNATGEFWQEDSDYDDSFHHLIENF